MKKARVNLCATSLHHAGGSFYVDYMTWKLSEGCLFFYKSNDLRRQPNYILPLANVESVELDVLS
jgi:hypothetical protein